MQVISLNRDAIETVFDAFADEFSSEVITVSLVNVLFDSSQLSAHEKNEIRAGLTRQIGNYDIIPQEVQDWSRVQQIFTDRSELWASKRYEFIQGNLKNLDQAGLSPQEMVFVPDQRSRNLCLLNLQSKLEANKILSNKEIARDADLAIDAVHLRYQAMFEKAMAAVVSRDGKERMNVKESVTVLKYLMHRGCDPSCADREIPTFFKDEVIRLLQLDPETRAAKMNEFISTDLHIKYTPSKLIDSMSIIPCGETSTKIFRESGRCFAAVKFGRITLPFYLSSGQFPKDGVIPGKWYPFFGVGEDGWLNKESDRMPDYYESPKLAKIAKLLDEDFGDLRDEGAVYEVEEFPDEASEFLNSDMREMVHLSDEADQRVYDNEEMSEYLSQSISGITALIDAGNADERTAAAAHLAELDFKFGKNKGNADQDSFISARRAHYLTVGDPIAISSEQTAAPPEQKE